MYIKLPILYTLHLMWRFFWIHFHHTQPYFQVNPSLGKLGAYFFCKYLSKCSLLSNISYSSSPKWALCFVTSFQREWKGSGRETLQWETWKTHSTSSQWKLILIVCSFDMMCWKWHFTSVILLPKTHSPSLSMRETAKWPKLRNIP